MVKRVDEITQKIGVQTIFMDSLLTGSMEYSLSPGKGYGLLSSHDGYEVIKGLIKYRLFESIALLAGASMDSEEINRHNGFAVHGGVELPPRAAGQFSGLYEIGAHFGSNWLILHRVSVSLSLKN